MLKIDRGIPVTHTTKNTRYPWKRMKIGDSFLFPEHLKEQSCRVAAAWASKRFAMKFSVGITKQGLRCWRIG